MIECRPFNNSDSPRIALFWQQHHLDGLARPMTPPVLEQVVLGKLHFRPQDMVLAMQNDILRGLVHFSRDRAPSPENTPGDTPRINMLLVDDTHENPAAVADELLQAARDLHGDDLQTAGPLQPNLFYEGLYGGSGFPGLLTSDTIVIEALQRNRFTPVHRRGIFRAPAASLSVSPDREVRQLRRRARSRATPCLPDSDWEKAGPTSHLERHLIRLDAHPGGPLLGQIETWDPSPLADRWGGPVVGIHRPVLHQDEHEGLIHAALISEAITFLQRTPASFIEIHDDLADPAMLLELGFEIVGEALELATHSPS